MQPCLVDVNVLLALLLPRHEHRRLALSWYNGLGSGEAGLCRIAQLGLVRLLQNKTVMGREVISAAQGLRVTGELLEDERLEFLDEPAGLDNTLAALLNYPVPTPQLMTDAYLAAFAISSGRRLATFERGFRQFRGLDVHILGS